MSKVTVRGMRGKWSPMSDTKTTAAQAAAIAELVDELRERARFLVEVRHSTYIGPGCAAERGDITVCADGAIYAMVTREGQVY